MKRIKHFFFYISIVAIPLIAIIFVPSLLVDADASPIEQIYQFLEQKMYL